jgi:hypothetical protein
MQMVEMAVEVTMSAPRLGFFYFQYFLDFFVHSPQSTDVHCDLPRKGCGTPGSLGIQPIAVIVGIFSNDSY